MSDEVSKDDMPRAFFPDLNPEDSNDVTEIESLCMHCYEQGVTRLLLTKIPFFREVIISSFQCDHCQYSDRSIQSGGRIQEKGIQYTLSVRNSEDMNRQVVKSDYASFAIPELEFEQIPSKKGEVNTVEGLLESVVTGLQLMQKERREVDAEKAEKIDEFIKKLLQLKELQKPFTIIVNDPTGNSFIENPNAPHKDEHLIEAHYVRTHQQDVDIGAVAEDEDEDEISEEATTVNKETSTTFNDEVLCFSANCPNCNAPCGTNMKLIDIPYFKQVVIMATSCEVCGHRDSEVKGGCGIEDLGQRITLHLTDIKDLNRDILKSDTCGVRIPELDLELVDGTLGGKFTTVEGLLTQIKEQLEGKNPFLSGDSSHDGIREKMKAFCSQLDKVITGERLDVHLIIDDPAGNSYMENIYAPDDDPEMKIERYTRSFEQNEELGLNDMKTENYSNNE